MTLKVRNMREVRKYQTAAINWQRLFQVACGKINGRNKIFSSTVITLPYTKVLENSRFNHFRTFLLNRIIWGFSRKEFCSIRLIVNFIPKRVTIFLSHQRNFCINSIERSIIASFSCLTSCKNVRLHHYATQIPPRYTHNNFNKFTTLSWCGKVSFFTLILMLLLFSRVIVSILLSAIRLLFCVNVRSDIRGFIFVQIKRTLFFSFKGYAVHLAIKCIRALVFFLPLPRIVHVVRKRHEKYAITMKINKLFRIARGSISAKIYM